MYGNTLMAHPDGFQFSSDAELAAVPLPKSTKKRSSPEPESKLEKLIIASNNNNKLNFKVPTFAAQHYSEIELDFHQAEDVFKVISHANTDKLIFSGNFQLEHLRKVKKLISHLTNTRTLEIRMDSKSIANLELLKAIQYTKVNKVILNRLWDFDLKEFFEMFKELPDLQEFVVEPDRYESPPDSKKMDLINEYFNLRKTKKSQDEKINEFKNKLRKNSVITNPF